MQIIFKTNNDQSVEIEEETDGLVKTFYTKKLVTQTIPHFASGDNYAK